MKSRFFLAMATLSLLIAGCENKDFEEAGLLNGNVRIKATMEQKEATRSLVDDSGKFTWATGDKISVFTSTNGNREFTLSSGNGETEATFGGTLVSDETMSTCAVYPYNAGHTVSGTTLTVTLPAEYGDFTTVYAPNTHAIMVAKIDAAQSQASLSNLDFKHLGGVLRFAIDNMPVDAAQFVFTATDKNVTGTFSVNLENTEPVINAGSSAATNNTVTIKFKPLTAATDGMTFYVPLPVGEYNGFSIAVKKQDGTQLASFSTTAKNTLSRRTLARIPKLRFTSVGGSLENAEANVSSNTDVEKALNNISSSTDPVMDLNASSEVTQFNLPESFTSGSTTSSELNINYSAAPSTIKVTEYSGGTTSSNDSKGEVNITIPAATSGNAPAVTIQTPTLTAGLYAAEGGTATYGEVTATTANNTLIVGNGVTINKLTVNGGNVRVKGNAKIETLEKASGLGTVYIYKESAEAQLPTIPEGFEVVDAAIADMKNVFANGGTYTLQKDLNIIGADMTVAAGVTATLDLNGYIITAENTQTGNIEVYGTLTLKDGTADAGTGVGTGKIVTNSDYTATSGYALIKATGESAKVIMESGYVYAVRDDAVNKGQFAMGVDAGGDFTMTGGKIEAGWYAVSGNGNNKTQNSIIEIKGGELISTSDYAIYLPHSGEATISGGTVNGAAGAVSIQRGTLNISNDANIMSLGNGDTGEWGDGTGNQPNCAVMVAAKYGDCTVNISGGNFSAEGDAILLGTGSTSYNVEINVSGGTFSDPSALAYLTDNADVNVLLNKDYTLTKPIQLTNDGTVTINLNQKTLTVNETSSTWLSVSKGTVTLKNGKIVANEYSSTTIGGVAVSANATLNVEGIIYESNGAALFVKDHATLNVTGGTKITVPAYAVTTNASDPTQKVTINLSSSTFTGSDPVLLNIASDVTIDGCTMNGTMHGMVLRGGTATVKNSTITLNYPDDDYASMSSYFDERNWGSGNMINLAALTIGNKSPNAYQYPTVITLINTTVQSTGEHAEYFPALYAYANSGEGLGVTLSYDDQCKFTGDIEYGSTNITVNGSAVVSDSNGGFVVAGSSNE